MTGQARLKPGAVSPIQVIRAQTLGPSCAALPDALSEKWVRGKEWSLEPVLMWRAGIMGSSIT